MSAGANLTKTDLDQYGECRRCGQEALLYSGQCDRCHEGGYLSSAFGRALAPGTPRGEYYSVVGRNRWSRRISMILNYRTEAMARAAMRELRRDHGHDDTWS